MFKNLAAVIVLSLVFSGSASADAYNNAYDDYQAGNYKDALTGFKALAETGDVRAQTYVGLMYDLGQGVSQDYGQSVNWYRKAAEQGYGYAQNYLGYMCQEGKGIAQDYVQAYMWYSLAAAGGDTVAIAGRDFIAKDMTPVQIAEAQSLARDWEPG